MRIMYYYQYNLDSCHGDLIPVVTRVTDSDVLVQLTFQA